MYRTDDARFVVKLKDSQYTTPAAALVAARNLRRAARNFADIIGPEHSISNHFLIAGNGSDCANLIVIQPYLKEGLPLFYIDYAALTPETRRLVADQLLRIIRRSYSSYLKSGLFPDVYGRSAASPEERAHRNSPGQLPARLWSFIVRRTLLRAHNLLIMPDGCICLVDYDPVDRSALYKRIYYAARATLFLRDLFFIWLMKHTGWAY